MLYTHSTALELKLTVKLWLTCTTSTFIGTTPSLRASDSDRTLPPQYYLHSKPIVQEPVIENSLTPYSLFYHTAILLLFQPFINLTLTTSAVIPKEVCQQAADAITGIIRSYSDLYTLRRTPSFAPYFVLVSAIIHLLSVKTEPTSAEARGKLAQAVSDLEEMTECHGLALRAIAALRWLSQRWGVDGFPETRESQASDSSSTSSTLPDHFSPDISILQTLQSIQPVLSQNDSPLFSPFPMQGLPGLVHSSQLENNGFKRASESKFN